MESANNPGLHRGLTSKQRRLGFEQVYFRPVCNAGPPWDAQFYNTAIQRQTRAHPSMYAVINDGSWLALQAPQRATCSLMSLPKLSSFVLV